MMRRNPLLKWVLAALLALAALGSLPRLWQAAHKPPGGGLPVVTVALPHPPKDNLLTLPGSTEAINQVNINARATGYMTRRLVDIGSKVQAGQLLAVIQAPDMDRQVDQAKAEVVRAAAGSEQAQADVTRAEAAVAEAQAAVARAKARLLQSQANDNSNQAKLSQTMHALNNRRADRTRYQSQQQLAELTWHRWRDLVKDGAVPLQDADERRSQFEVASAQLRSGKLSVDEAKANVQAARDQVAASHADVEAARADLVSAQRGVDAAVASLNSTRHNASASQAGVVSNQASANRYLAMQGFERVLAPYNGVITSRSSDTGALIEANTPAAEGLFGIARIDTIRIRVAVPQAYMTWMQLGMPASVTVQEYPEHPFEGKVAKVAGGLDPATHTILTEVHVANPASKLLPGMYAQVRFDLPANKILLIPSNTLLINGEGNLVGVVDAQDHLHYKKVQIGRDLGTEIEILGGLSPQDRLVANPNYDLQEGMLVKVVAPKTDAAK